MDISYIDWTKEKKDGVLLAYLSSNLTNSFVEEFLKWGLEPLAWPFQALAADDIYIHAHSHNNSGYFPFLAGQELRALKNGQTAAEIVEEIMSEARETLLE